VKSPFRNTGRVTIELSNQCSQAVFHWQCPLHLEKTPVFMPEKTAQGILSQLGKFKFTGVVVFHNYNEPLEDPRLYSLLDYAKRKCPKARPFIMTSGRRLDKVVLHELKKHGVKKVYVSAYSKAERRRLSKLDPTGIKYRVRYIPKFDDRLNTYNEGQKPRKARCFAPFGEVVVRATGDVVMCCMDWKSEYVFGNVHKNSLAKILGKKKMMAAYQKLSNGKRIFSCCRGCKMGGRYQKA